MATPEILLKAIRRYRHNNSDEIIIGYDEKEVNEIVRELLDKKEVSAISLLLNPMKRWYKKRKRLIDRTRLKNKTQLEKVLSLCYEERGEIGSPGTYKVTEDIFNQKTEEFLKLLIEGKRLTPIKDSNGYRYSFTSYCFYDEFVVNTCPFRFFDGSGTFPMDSTLRTIEWKEYQGIKDR